ncbi:MAG: phosphoribosylanthranilate isomerase [Xanthobacter sp.]
MTLEVKICGLKTADAVDAALEAGADFLGFVHFPRSPRHLALADAPALISQVGSRAQKVALTVNADDALLEQIITAFKPDLLQLHGAESPKRVAQVRTRFGLPVMKALAVGQAEDLAVIPAYESVADRLLLDAKPPRDSVLPGGNGVPFDWNLLAGFDARHPLMLSGGLNAENVAQALSHLYHAHAHVDGVDVSSGVEDAPGVKSPDRIRAFVAAARTAAASNLSLKAQAS